MTRTLLRLATIAIVAISLSACVESKTPLLRDAKPLLGQQFELHLYEDFANGRAQNFHATSYAWRDNKYIRATRVERDVSSFVLTPLERTTDLIIQTADNTNKQFDYWIGRKLVDGVYLIFRVNEADVDQTTRDEVCAKNQPQGFCFVDSFENLVKLARATSVKPVRDPALGVIVEK